MATQNTKTKTTLADKDKKVLMILGALVILALAWFLGYQKFNEQRETVATENDQLAMEVSQLRAKVSKKAQVEADTEKKNARTEQVLLAYPSELRTQDAINRFDQLAKKAKGLTITPEIAVFLSEHRIERYETYKNQLLIGTKRAEILSEIARD